MQLPGAAGGGAHRAPSFAWVREEGYCPEANTAKCVFPLARILPKDTQAGMADTRAALRTGPAIGGGSRAGSKRTRERDLGERIRENAEEKRSAAYDADTEARTVVRTANASGEAAYAEQEISERRANGSMADFEDQCARSADLIMHALLGARNSMSDDGM